MQATQKFKITLPIAMADIVRKKVATGQYATESDVIQEGIEALIQHEQSLNDWLLQEVGPDYDACINDPESALTLEQVKDSLVAEYNKFK